MRRNPRLVIWFVALACTSTGCRPGQPPAADPVVANSQPDQPAMPAVDPSAADLEALQGWWLMVEDHPEPGEEAGPSYLMLIEGDKVYEFASYGIQMNGLCICIRLDATKSPKHMDRWHLKDTSGRFSQAIYRLKGDELTEVYGTTKPGGRPTQYDDPGSSYRKFRRCAAPKSIRLTGDEECQPKLTSPGTPADIKRW